MFAICRFKGELNEVRFGRVAEGLQPSALMGATCLAGRVFKVQEIDYRTILDQYLTVHYGFGSRLSV
jgi:hypothetical protein